MTSHIMYTDVNSCLQAFMNFRSLLTDVAYLTAALCLHNFTIAFREQFGAIAIFCTGNDNIHTAALCIELVRGHTDRRQCQVQGDDPGQRCVHFLHFQESSLNVMLRMHQPSRIVPFIYVPSAPCATELAFTTSDINECTSRSSY